jgi:lipoate-protein ligase A
MDPELVPRLIRIGRERLSEKGIRSADKAVTPLSWFTNATLEEVEEQLAASFRSRHETEPDLVTGEELEAAQALVESRYSTRDWIFRLP